MFGIKGRDTFNKPQSDLMMFFGYVRKKWMKIFPVILGLTLIGILVFVGYVWYQFVYTKELTGEEKINYINQKKSEITFNREKFDATKDRVIQRKENYVRERETFRDIFYH